MRNFIVILLSFLLLVVVVSCSSDKKEEASDGNKKVEVLSGTLDDIISKRFENAGITKAGDTLIIKYDIKSKGDINKDIESALTDIKEVFKNLETNDEFNKYNLIKFQGMGTFTDSDNKDIKNNLMLNTFVKESLEKVKDFNDVTWKDIPKLQEGNQSKLKENVKKEIDPEILSLFEN